MARSIRMSEITELRDEIKRPREEVALLRLSQPTPYYYPVPYFPSYQPAYHPPYQPYQFTYGLAPQVIGQNLLGGANQ